MTNALKIFGLLALTLATLALTGCESESPMASIIPTEPTVDTAPPTIPTGLSAASADQLVKVSWDANVLDTDFSGFMVYRVVWGTRYPMLNLPQQDNNWIDDHPVNVACTYLVTALDEAGNESGWAAVNFLGDENGPDIQLEF